jgi:hypothetical protein
LDLSKDNPVITTVSLCKNIICFYNSLCFNLGGHHQMKKFTIYTWKPAFFCLPSIYCTVFHLMITSKFKTCSDLWQHLSFLKRNIVVLTWVFLRNKVR